MIEYTDRVIQSQNYSGLSIEPKGINRKLNVEYGGGYFIEVGVEDLYKGEYVSTMIGKEEATALRDFLNKFLEKEE